MQIKTQSRIKFIAFVVIYFSLIIAMITGFFCSYYIKYFVIYIFILVLFFLFFLKCTNCGLSLAAGRKSFSNVEVYGRRYFPSFYCSRCGQNHWHPYDPPNEDYKKEDFDVNEFIKAKKKKKPKPK